MSVLTLSRGEVIRIGDDIEVCVLDVHGDQVRLGIQASFRTPEEQQICISTNLGGCPSAQTTKS